MAAAVWAAWTTEPNQLQRRSGNGAPFSYITNADQNLFMSLEGWKTLFDVGSLIVVLLTFGFGAGALLTGNRINKLQAEKSRKEAAVASLEIANANRAASEAQKDAENARLKAETVSLEAAKIEQAAAWRVLSDESKTKLVAGLAHGVGGSVELSYPANDPEALFLARQIEEIFKLVNSKSGNLLWKIHIQPRQYSRAIFWDIRIFGQNEAVVQSVKSAFVTAAVPYISEPVPNIVNDGPGMMIGGTPPSDLMIFVGSKRPPN
jgi:hypothetical protein